MKFHIGYGEDIHRLVEDRKLILGGVEIPFEKGLLGHSDADVVYHALSDALLGAAALGDIGQHFKTTDPRWEGADSSVIAKISADMVTSEGYRIENVDISIACEKPHLMSYIEDMRINVATAIGIDFENVSIKAMTNEGLDAVGRGEAIRAVAVALISKE